jgi:hypothetical protein
VAAASSLTQHGITWHFAGDITSGSFANGDHWVVGPVTLMRITPEDTTLSDDTDLHGTVLNPQPDTKAPYEQGWDSRIEDGTRYQRNLNIARTLPRSIPPATSVVSVRSYPTHRDRRKLWIRDAAVLTVLASPPPGGSFRPPYAGTDKTIVARVAAIDLQRLESLPTVRSAPRPDAFRGAFQQPLLDVVSQWGNSGVKNANAGANYGRDITREVADAVLFLNLNQKPEHKRALLVRVLQRGIDTYGLARAGMVWYPNGGHNSGRKLPLLFAGWMLSHDDMLAWADGGRHRIFQEDLQHFYIGQEDVDTPRRGKGLKAYTRDMVGLAEWASNPLTERAQTGSEWDKRYRNVNGSVNTGVVLAARIMGLREAWNCDPFFDYIELRYWPQEKLRTEGVTIPAFHRELWLALDNRNGDSR